MLLVVSRICKEASSQKRFTLGEFIVRLHPADRLGVRSIASTLASSPRASLVYTLSPFCSCRKKNLWRVRARTGETRFKDKIISLLYYAATRRSFDRVKQTCLWCKYRWYYFYDHARKLRFFFYKIYMFLFSFFLPSLYFSFFYFLSVFVRIYTNCKRHKTYQSILIHID